jgi:hypothetical protein
MLEMAKLEVKSIQRQLPIDYGNGFLLGSCDILEKEKMYDYVFLLNEEAEKQAKSDLELFREQSMSNIKNTLRNDPATKMHLKYGMSFGYTYKDSKGETICTFIISDEK